MNRCIDQPFSPGVIQAALDVESIQSSYGTDYVAYLRDNGIAQHAIDKPARVVDINGSDRNPQDVLFVHQPMANTLLPHRLVSLVGLSQMFPEKRVISMSNSGYFGQKHVSVSLPEIFRLRRGMYTPLLKRVIDYLGDQQIDGNIVHVGESFGGDVATAAASITMGSTAMAVALDPVAVVERPTSIIMNDLKASSNRLLEYLDANQQDLSRQAFDNHNIPDHYIRGFFMRASNLQAGAGLRKGTYGRKVFRALTANATVAVVRGAKSELTYPDETSALLQKITMELPSKAANLHDLVLPTHGHLFPNDLALHNASIAQSVQNAHQQ